jgi:hypothetical protein
MDYQAFWLQKRDNFPEEYEDAFKVDLETACFAVADGASESIFAAAWAQLLVEQFVLTAGECPLSWNAWLPAVQQSWAESTRDRKLPWYAEVKLQQGAFATFLGLVVAPCEDDIFTWHATAVGDTCLFHTRGAELLSAFPVDRSEQFDTHPWLVGSRTPPEIVKEERAVDAQGDAKSSDRLWMMTDALAQWFLAEHEAGNQPWTEFEWLMTTSGSEEQFAEWIEGLRKSKRLRNDDVTLLAVDLQ